MTTGNGMVDGSVAHWDRLEDQRQEAWSAECDRQERIDAATAALKAEKIRRASATLDGFHHAVVNLAFMSYLPMTERVVEQSDDVIKRHGQDGAVLSVIKELAFVTGDKRLTPAEKLIGEYFRSLVDRHCAEEAELEAIETEGRA
jgi:hypothetical protein